jgi:hypothetical protein
MLTQFRDARAFGSLMAGVSLLMASAAVFARGETRPSLSNLAAIGSRGGNPGNVETTSECIYYNDSEICLEDGNDCILCGVTSYTSLTGGSGYWYLSNGKQSCGSEYAGRCDAYLDCNSLGGNPTGTCESPPWPFVQAVGPS